MTDDQSKNLLIMNQQDEIKSLNYRLNIMIKENEKLRRINLGLKAMIKKERAIASVRIPITGTIS